MGFKAISTSRSAATTAVSKQATIINSSSGFAVAGQSITANTSISLSVNTPGQAPSNPAAGLSISSINYLNANGSISTANAVSTTTGGNIKINGAGFSSPMIVTVGGTTLANANVTVANSTAIIASLGNANPGNVSIATFNSTGSGAQLANAVFYSGVPVWTTTSFTLVNGTAANVALVASSDSTLTYTLQAGSTLPTGMSLVSTGYISGTPTGYTSSTSSTVVIIATDLENQATQQTITWSVQVGDPQFNYTTLLLNGDGANGAQNNTFLDSSTNNFTVTRFGNTTQGTYSPYSVTGWSNYFGSSSNYLQTPSNAVFAFPGAFTVEGWFYWPAIPSAGTLCGPLTGGAFNFYTDGNYLSFNIFGSGNVCTVASFPSRNTWHHIAMTRDASNNCTIWVDGVSSATGTSAHSFVQGAWTIYGGSNNGGSGWVSNFRVVKGTAVYTSAFTPSTTPLTAIANTSLLTCQSNRFIDNSTNNFTLTIGGTPSVQAFSPFNPSAAYSPSSYGGSASFDGTGDYLLPAASSAYSFGTGDFTIEFWCYQTSGTNNGLLQIAGTAGGFGGLAGIAVAAQPGTQWVVYYANGSQVGIPGVSVLNAWYHIALVRLSGALKLYINGVAFTVAASDTTNYTSTNLVVGGYYSTSYLWSGYISNLRIVNGTAIYTTNFTPPTAPVTAVANTSLLLNYTNAGIIDQHSTNVLETLGNAQSSTAVEKFGGASMRFDGTGDSLKILDNPNINLGSGDFTIEYWSYFNVVNAQMTIISKGWNSSSAYASYLIWMNSDATLRFLASSNGGAWDIANERVIGTMTSGTWTHIAVTRSGTTFRAFVNGVINNAFTFTSSASLASIPAQTLFIGDRTNGDTSMNGYLDDLRITKFARYTANFTPPTAAFVGQ